MSQLSYPTVLIVEDEPLIRFYESELAEGAGFLTVQAEDADKALQELEGPLEIQILLTDVNMPGPMDGLDLAALVHRRWPEMKIVIVSGRPDGRAAEQLEDAILVAKPFTCGFRRCRPPIPI